MLTYDTLCEITMNSQALVSPSAYIKLVPNVYAGVHTLRIEVISSIDELAMISGGSPKI